MKRWTIGILTPLLDGFYYGDIIWGISHGIKLNDMDMDMMVVTTSIYNKKGKRVEYSSRVGWDLADAWIIVADAVTEDYVKRLSDTGKPIISIAIQYKEVNTYVIKCDNQVSALESTRHLIELGHRSIAFIGDLNNPDFKERFNGYQDGLKESGISSEEHLVYDIGSGEEGAHRMIIDGMQFTAIVAATDSIAVGLIDVFSKSGICIPDNVAIVGFDDSGLAVKCRPTLSTVRQPIVDLGLMAINRTARILKEHPVETDITLMPARLIIRESSGGTMIDNSVNDQTLTWKNIQDNELEELIESHHQIGLNLIDSEDLLWLRWTNQHWGSLGIWSEHPTAVESELSIDRVFSSKGDLLPNIGSLFREEQFPPISMMPLRSNGETVDIAVVQPVHYDGRQWGFIATVGPVNERLLRGYDIRQLPTLIGVMIERKLLLTDLQIREAANAELVQKMEIVSRTTNDGVYDFDLETNQIEWISDIKHMLGANNEEMPKSADEFAEYVHPEDFPLVTQAWYEHFNERKPFGIEFRMNKKNDYIWVFSAGEAIFDTDGKPIRFIGSITDIHVRKQAEIAMLASEEKYRDFFNNTPVMILSLNKQFVITDANPFWLDEMEYSYEHTVGRNCTDFLTSDSRKSWLDHWRENSFAHLGISDMELKWVTGSAKIIEGIVNCKRYEDVDEQRIYLTVRDITERNRAERQIQHLAYHDSLTGLANRRFFNEKLAEVINTSSKNRKRVAIMVMDLDHFKVVNDTLGHDTGDQLLQYVAKVINDHVESKGIAARIGGDEFMIMIESSRDKNEVKKIVDLILANLQQTHNINGHELCITASIGLSWYPDNGTEVSSLIKMADTAMYRAKHQGRNQSEVYLPSMDS